MSIVNQALWVIERNSGSALTLEGLAQAVGVSRAHLAYAFGAATGVPAMKYLRGRRLSDAARKLALGAPDILTIALDSGYGSHEAFTRAFRQHFGATPEEVRSRASLDGLALIPAGDLKPRSSASLDPPRLVPQGALRVVGQCARYGFDEVGSIPAQWQHFMSVHSSIPFRSGEIPIGVTCLDEDGAAIDYTCGVEVERFAKATADLVQVTISPRLYAVFEHRGHASTLFDTYTTIWNEALPAVGHAVADSPIIERHNPSFDPRTGNGGLTLWIPLVK